MLLGNCDHNIKNASQDAHDVPSKLVTEVKARQKESNESGYFFR